MSEIPVKVIIDLSKPEGERESIVPLTAEEIAELEANAAKFAEEQAVLKAEKEARNQAKESAKTKLAALGLSDTEIAALLG